MISKYILLITFKNQPELLFFAHSKMISSISIYYELFGLLLIICLYTDKWFQVLLCGSNNLTSVNCLHTLT